MARNIGAAGLLSFERQAKRIETQVANITDFYEQVQAPGSLAFVLEMMSNYARDKGRPGNWTDQLGNLRRSISWVVLARGESATAPYQTETQGVKTARAINQTSGPAGFLFAGMEYAPYVEAKAPKFTVVSGALDQFRPTIGALLGDRMKIRGPAELRRAKSGQIRKARGLNGVDQK